MFAMILVYNGEINDVAHAIQEQHTFIPIAEIVTGDKDNKKYLQVLFEDIDSVPEDIERDDENYMPLTVVMGRFCLDNLEDAVFNFSEYYFALEELMEDYNAGEFSEIQQLDDKVFALIKELPAEEELPLEPQQGEKTVPVKKVVQVSKVFTVNDCPPEIFEQDLEHIN